MFKHLFDNAQNMAAFPVFSLMVFFVFFVVIALWVVSINKKQVEEIGRLPLDENDGDSINS